MSCSSWLFLFYELKLQEAGSCETQKLKEPLQFRNRFYHTALPPSQQQVGLPEAPGSFSLNIKTLRLNEQNWPRRTQRSKR